ncbi:MAG TPA: hypothetical protein VN770_11710, partial [Gaiellaceae bacterium]|nr:hypothetical protein [Gaiellaceae bacterium]
PIQPVPVNPGGPMQPATTASLSSHKAGAKPVALTVKVHYEMVCGQPGPGKAVLTLPAQADVPAKIDRSAVLVNGTPSPSVTVSGHAVSIAMPLKRPGVTCMVVGPGTLTLTLTRAAGIGNPTAAGTYTIRVRRNTLAFTARVAISA